MRCGHFNGNASSPQDTYAYDGCILKPRRGRLSHTGAALATQGEPQGSSCSLSLFLFSLSLAFGDLLLSLLFLLRLSLLLRFELFESFWVFLALPDKRHRAICCHLNIHVLPERARLDRHQIALNAVFCTSLDKLIRKPLQELIIELLGWLVRHRSMKVRLRAFHGMIQSELADKEDLPVGFHYVCRPLLTLLVLPQPDLE